MTTDSPLNAASSPVSRSAMSNGSRAVLFGDGRSSGARRFRDLCEGFGSEVGGFSALSPSGQQVVRRLAQVSVELELQEAARAAGSAINPVAFCTLVNSQRRLLRDLRAYQSKSAPPSLHEITRQILAEKEGAHTT